MSSRNLNCGTSDMSALTLGDEASKIIILAHALLGCDTTSRIFGVNKAVAFTKLMPDKMFCTYADVFTRLSSHHNDVIDAR